MLRYIQMVPKWDSRVLQNVIFVELMLDSKARAHESIAATPHPAGLLSSLLRRGEVSTQDDAWMLYAAL